MNRNLTTRPIVEADFPAVAQFLKGRARPGEAIDPGALPLEQRLRWVLLENPAHQPDVPLGWAVWENDRLVGTLLTPAVRMAARDFTCIALIASQFYVEPEYHGAGIGPFMRYLREGRRFLLLNNTANTISGSIFKQCGGKVIAGADHTMLGVARARPLAEEWFYRKTGRRMLALSAALPAIVAPPRLKTSAAFDNSLIPIHSPDDVAKLDLIPPTDLIAIVRDIPYLRWRYFAGDRGKDIYRFQFPDEPDRFVAVNRIRLGHRGQIRVLNILDLWPPTTSASAPAIAMALARRYAGQFDTLWLRGQPGEAEVALRQIGFLTHSFPGPLGWYIDPAQILPHANFYLMPGESE